VDRLAETLEHFRRHARSVSLLHASGAVEQAHDDRLAVLRRHGRNAHVDLLIPDFDVEASILRRRRSEISRPDISLSRCATPRISWCPVSVCG